MNMLIDSSWVIDVLIVSSVGIERLPTTNSPTDLFHSDTKRLKVISRIRIFKHIMHQIYECQKKYKRLRSCLTQRFGALSAKKNVNFACF